MLLPPAYVVRGKVIFILGNVCLFTFWGGVSRSCLGWGGTQSSLGRGGGVPIQPWMGGYPISGGGGYPNLGGGTPSPGGYPNLGRGYPNLGRGATPSPGGYPISGYPPRNSKHLLLQLRGGRCASCVHEGGLSCLKNFQFCNFYSKFKNYIF